MPVEKRVENPVERRLRPGFAVRLTATVSVLRRGRGDPTMVLDPATQVVWRAVRTPDGPAQLRLQAYPSTGEIVGQAWGPGAAWALDGVPDLVGARDDPAAFTPLPEHPALCRAYAAHGDIRIGRSNAVVEALVPAILEQKVTGTEAFGAYRRLVRRFGESAPGPAAGRPGGLYVPPDPQTWAQIPTWDWLQAGVDAARYEPVRAAVRRARALEHTLDEPDSAKVSAGLRSLPRVGPWTSAEVRQRAHGDPDAFSFGDYHIARSVTFVLTGEQLDDAACAELIEPYRGQRYRVQLLLGQAGLGHPRHGPRMSLPTHVPSAGRRG